MATCGGNESSEQSSNGEGFGITVEVARRAARAMADYYARADGQLWIDSVSCPRGCPFEADGKVVLGDIVVTTQGPPLGKGPSRLHRYQAVKSWKP